MKQKTHSGAKKRFRLTANNKVVGRKAATRHLLTNKNKRQTKLQKKAFILSSSDTKTAKALLKV
ncbi:MAG: hypothetical protein UT55_C0009G0020 [Candidatus Peregrinibacteria bacterium GW2011_GWE2_39_6]|nr:MAG: hypothetical protein UT36_C0014G0020 [Candidatus Peregrinibacteria bacterium GW2011_GWF2_39_17]KKR26388.1 MAG: hypothetical protein UT55_C0009G0020 [Candidatus Peregrinibacteria bacterium GW2011_GWE2_39_6]HCW32536.1 50S ribosomal protein L35 [Candidatus Peregrinibacteria bacterium]